MKRHSRVSNLLSVILALLLAFPSATVFAGEDEAREYFKQAKQAYTKGDYERAAELLEKAYSEEPNLTYQYNRIRALEGAGDYEGALEVLNNYEQPMLDAKGFEDITDIKASLQKKVGEDGQPSDEKTADDLRERKEKKETDEGAAETTGDSDDGAAERTDASGDSDGTMRLLGWGLTGLGGAAGLTGIAFGSTLLLPPETRKAHNDPNTRKTEAQQRQVQTHRIMTVVFGSVGAAGLIAGGTILLTQSPETDDSASTAELEPRVAPFVRGDGGGATLHFRF